jgi:hypothetical protein
MQFKTIINLGMTTAAILAAGAMLLAPASAQDAGTAEVVNVSKGKSWAGRQPAQC